jgi:hypothetical protein
MWSVCDALAGTLGSRTFLNDSNRGRLAALAANEDGRRGAVTYALVETARLNDVNPEAWLDDVISRIADHPNTKIDELLPWKWTRAGSQGIAAELLPITSRLAAG